MPKYIKTIVLLENKWYIDELYAAAIIKPLEKLALFLDKVVERQGIDGGVNGVGKLVNWGSSKLRIVQNGQVGFYLFSMIVGIAIILAIVFITIL